MGMAASQCRMLALTSLMSDLELQAQLISNQKMILSRRLSDATRKYTEAVSNQQLFIRTAEGTTENLTEENLVAAGYGIRYKNTPTVGGFKDWFEDASGAGEVNNPLQYALINGLATLYNPTDKTEKTVAEVPIITQTYYTADDAAAEAEYTRLTNEIKAKEEMFDLELDQIETQHEAAKTEYDSAKELIKKNIERTFGYFS